MFSNTFLKVFFLGWVGADPTIKGSVDDKFFVTISVANSYNIKDKEGHFNKKTDWYNVTFYGKSAEFVAHNIIKGSYVFIEGTIRIDKFKSNDGIERNAVKILGSSINLLKNKSKVTENDTQLDDVEFEESFNEKTPF
ncbi:MAG: single-stranded DNA-binding protein [Candidatus Riesia sp.]|nr:single-stranded DNA-binding protein [Candidatus Riesia sp.]